LPLRHAAVADYFMPHVTPYMPMDMPLMLIFHACCRLRAISFLFSPAFFIFLFFTISFFRAISLIAAGAKDDAGALCLA